MEIEGFGAGPGARQFDEFVAAGIALVVVEIIAVLALVGVAAAADDMHRQAPVEEVFEGRQLARGQVKRRNRGGGQQTDPEVGQASGGGHQESIRLVRPVADQDSIEAGLFGACESGDGWVCRG